MGSHTRVGIHPTLAGRCCPCSKFTHAREYADDAIAHMDNGEYQNLMDHYVNMINQSWDGTEPAEDLP